MVCNLKLPVGIDSFEKIRKNEFYYIDKTKLIEQLVETGGEVTLFTRPRRFGKTLNMSMLKAFLETGADVSLFEGLYIAENKALCDEYMGKYPVIFLSLKSVEGLNFEAAKYRITELIGREAQRFDFLLESDNLSDDEKLQYKAITGMQNGKFSMDEDILGSSIQILSYLLCRHFGQKAVILIDEYDVPLDKAFENGYYREMVSLIRGLFGMALKTNDSLAFAVLTGCLRITKESIFTGLNNFKVLSILDPRFDEQFGFTDYEVKKILEDYGLASHFEETKEWYDGYHFGKADIYCPWDVMNYLRDLQNDLNARPVSYWKNTSDNAIIRSFIDYTGAAIRKKLEVLIAGGSICQKIEEDLTYDYLHSSEDNLWSILYLTGYLTKVGERDKDGQIELRIPNKEVKEIFESTVRKWFEDSARVTNRKDLFDAVWNKDADKATKEISTLLRMTISYYDYRENFYHAFLAGIFAGAGYSVESNREHGEGRSDIVIYNDVTGQVAVFEAKYSRKLEDLEKDCQKALDQINTKMYAKEFEDAYEEVLCYGIAFYKKRCLVKSK